MISENKWRQYGEEGIDVKGITVHNTGNTMSAMEIFARLERGIQNNGCHFLVDENGVVEVMPLTWKTWHTGKGYDNGNMFTVAVEICRSESDDETYRKAEANAVELIRSLMEQYGLTEMDIYFHNDFNNRTYCPHRILQKYKSKRNWIKEVL